MGISGLLMIFLVLQPIISYEITARKRFPTLISPVVENNDQELNDYVSSDPDLTKAKNWFVNDTKEEFIQEEKVFYNISIPKLRINKALVALGGEDLSKSLIQYPGTSMPGQLGNPVIFGHSVLPVFFNPKNYLSIFSTLPKLDKGDEIFIEFEDSKYRFIVENMFEVLPTDLRVLDQDRSDSYLTLVTCTPPGHPLKPKRLIVRAKLVPYNS